MNGVFAIEKPTGISSAQFLSLVQRIFTNSKVFANDLAEMKSTRLKNYSNNGNKGSKRKLNNIKVKIGHGGTLDPLASGVLVVGIGNGTKRLQNYLNGSVKVYETEALLGASTTTGDSEGQVLSKTKFDHINDKIVEETKLKFKGEITQTPPIFSALKMNGKPLYEYAREGLPLPAKIKPREVQVYELTVCDDNLTKDHDWKFIKSELDEDGVAIDKKLSESRSLEKDELFFSKEYCLANGLEPSKNNIVKPQLISEDENVIYESDNFKAPLLHLIAKVSSGTYIRSLISDFGKAMDSSAYMVKLIRLEQAEWKLGKNVFKIENFENEPEEIWGPVLKKVLDEGSEIDLEKEFEKTRESYNKEKEQVEEQVEEPSSKRRKIDQVEQ
ncbi:hypothetical protein PACTADRAFT_49636 [Pachysolen tannophilus NRRL Y-2460]|uniref:tRNA pseudouridine(55) synthase n=1 Tax=Pachysolen tannophilus NRRL Y-2460 TaxID=669874 RepID=A0A1E4TWX2_PACTA|nr:hypothetical protein PACTADRAFT_49636 [Pachysolen tannophilus NRRL Y-2460]